MTLMSGVFILPAAMRDAGNAFGEQMGWGSPSYSIALSPTGAEPATHWGARADLYPGFFDLLGNPPEGAPDFVFLVDEVDENGSPLPIPALPNDLLIHVRDVGEPYQHWLDVTQAQGLQMVQEPPLQE